MEVHYLRLIIMIINTYFGQSITVGAKRIDTTPGLYNIAFIFSKIVI